MSLASESRTSIEPQSCVSQRLLAFSLHPPRPRLTPRMGSKPLKGERPAPVKVKTVIVPEIPQDVIDEILPHLVTYSEFGSLRACSLVSKSWVPSCQPHLFHTAFFTSDSVSGWLKTFLSPEDSPAHHVRDLRIQIGGLYFVPQTFFECIPWFTNAEKIPLLGPEPGGFRRSRYLHIGTPRGM